MKHHTKSTPTVSSTPFLATLVALLITASLGLSPRAAGQTSGPDPFVLLRGGEGDRQLGGSQYFSPDYLNNPHNWDGLNYYRFLSGMPPSYQETGMLMVGFPPQPPVLAEPLHVTSPLPLSAEELSRLADCAGEVFYMPFSRLRSQHQLSAPRLQRIDDYRAARRQLVTEIRAKLDELADAPASQRAADLAGLATAQAGRLQALEAEAEAIRVDLTSRGLFKYYDSEDDLNLLGSGWARGVDDTMREFYAMLEAAEYFDGLSIDQRSLLAEMAFEAWARANPVAPLLGDRTEPTPAPALFFLPATTRIRLAEKHPAALDEKVRAFLAQKNRLKDELRTAVYRRQNFLTTQRTERFTQLAAQEAPRFAELEVLAEEIRVGLAGLPYPDQPDAPLALSPDLTRRIVALVTRQGELQRDLARRLRALHAESPDARFEIVRRDESLAIARVEKTATLPPGLGAFNADLTRRYAELTGEYRYLRSAVQRSVQSSPGAGARGVDDLTADFGLAYRAQVNWSRYRDYYRAALEPGLSPAQRRVLFNTAFGDILEAVTPASS